MIYTDSQFTIQKLENIILEGSNVLKNKSNKNNAFDSVIKTLDKIENSSLKLLTYNKKNDDSPKLYLDNSRTIKIKTQKHKESFLKSVNNIDNNLINGDNILKSYEQSKNKKYNESTNRILNLDILTNININNEPQDENVFLNSINKSTILNLIFIFIYK